MDEFVGLPEVLILTSCEIVSCLMQTLHTILQVCVAAIANAHWAVLCPAWISDIQIDLTVLATLANRDVWPKRGSVAIEDGDSSELFVSFSVILVGV
jgi:hypothetical protein